MSKLMAGVSGVRGIVGDGIDPAVLLRYAAAFAGALDDGPIVFGRDSRPSGPALQHAVLAALLGTGRDVIDIGIVPTPTVQLSVERFHAAGGIALTASHNPVEWNALKFVGPDGRFLAPERAKAFLDSVDREPAWVRWDGLGSRKAVTDAIEDHVARILALEEVDVDAIRARRPKVVLDAVHGAGGAIGRRLLAELGAEATILFEEPTGHFPREPEPLAKNLGALCARVKELGADLGCAFDPDVDRLSLVDETGTAIGEECTLALAADHVLDVRPGPVVTNLSTSARLEAVAERHGQTVTRTPVGEAHVVQGIVDRGARIGGEGNGGVILPTLHLGRDAPGGVALILAGLARRGGTLSRWAGSLPNLVMVKEKEPVAGEPAWDAAVEAVGRVLPGAVEDRRDGLRLTAPGAWVHLRKSGTEPIIRIMAEAGDEAAARALIDAARSALR